MIAISNEPKYLPTSEPHTLYLSSLRYALQALLSTRLYAFKRSQIAITKHPKVFQLINTKPGRLILNYTNDAEMGKHAKGKASRSAEAFCHSQLWIGKIGFARWRQMNGSIIWHQMTINSYISQAHTYWICDVSDSFFLLVSSHFCRLLYWNCRFSHTRSPFRM